MKKENTLLFIGILIPILMIVFIALSIYLPQFFLNPQYDFLYVSGENYSYSFPKYIVEGNTVVKREPTEAEKEQWGYRYDESILRVYSAEKDVSTVISFADAQKLKLNPNSVSPDGFEVTHSRRNYSLFSEVFGGGYRGSGYVIRKKNGSGDGKKIDIDTSGSYYYGFKFLGWIEE